MEDCIFCSIIKGERECSLVHSDKRMIAFLPRTPVNPGQTLLMPKTHYEDIFHTPATEVIYLLEIASKISVAIQKTVRPIRVGVVAMGLDVQHAHFHLVPLHSQFWAASPRLRRPRGTRWPMRSEGIWMTSATPPSRKIKGPTLSRPWSQTRQFSAAHNSTRWLVPSSGTRRRWHIPLQRVDGDNDLGPIADVQRPENGADVALHGWLGEIEHTADRLVALPLHDQS
jgi:histidine triad (HIT) family protein